MDYLDPIKRRMHTRRLFIGYALMAILIALGTIILVLLAYGFTFDRSTGHVIQNGLVFVDTNPVAANVYVNGELRGRGDQRLVLPADDYSIEIWEEGYRTWRKDLSLNGGSLERLTYPLLIPEKLERSVYRRFDQDPQIISTSPDRRWLVLQESKQTDAFVVYDLDQAINLPSFFSLPAGVMNSEGVNSTLEVVEWSNDNIHFILKHTFDGGEEFLLINRSEVSQSQNLSSRFSDVSFTDISLIDKQYDIYHLFDSDSGTLLRAELAVDATETVLENVITYRSHGDEALLYIQDELPIGAVPGDEVSEETERTVGAYILEDDESFKISGVPRGDMDSYLLDIARFSGSWYVIVGTTQDNRVSVYKEPVEALRRDPSRLLLPVVALRTDSDATNIGFSGNSRNIMLQAGNEFAVYDAEKEQSHWFTFGDETMQKAFWMDGHRIVGVWQDKMHVIEFDGDNEQELSACRSSYRPMFDSDYEFAYCVAPPDANKPKSASALERISLRVSEK